MLEDISNKYSLFEVPKVVTMAEVMRICSIYEIPPNFLALLNCCGDRYEACDDIRSSQFNPSNALKNRSLIIFHPNILPQDNISKFKVLLPNVQPLERKVLPSPKTQVKLMQRVQKTAGNMLPVLDRISVTSCHCRTGNGESSPFEQTPLIVMQNIMQEKCRAYVVIRSRNRLVYCITQFAALHLLYWSIFCI